MEIDEGPNDNDDLEMLNNEEYNKKNKIGVLIKLVHALKHESPTSAVRFKYLFILCNKCLNI